ncbi:replication factor C small subunit [Candidatus Woesearchaeota archaeon]|nr:replication factor C small subunit [Candidatus Woesearchaeota archaeon]
MTAIWTEKYRPQKFSDIFGQKEIVARVEAFVKGQNMPHLLFAGPAGVGKTSLAIVVAKELYGDTWRANFLELNASDERGIDVVRNQVKNFARTRSIGNVPFKIIYLDECDALTREAQQALRRTMENYTKTCRFILSCNYSSKILDPIKSRCTVFKFKPLQKEEIFRIIEKISKNEKINVNEKAKAALYEASAGDCRKVENILQGCAALTDKVDEEEVYDLASTARPKEVLQVMELAVKGQFLKARELLLSTMLNHGLSGLDIIKQIQKEVWELELDDNAKLKLVEACGDAEFRMVEGSDDFIQLESLLAKFPAAKNG